MSINKKWRKGDLGQLMAVLLVVLPMLIVSVSLIISYWSVMQADYKLKLIANMTADYANRQQDLQNVFKGISDGQGGTFKQLKDNIDTLCPSGTKIEFKAEDVKSAKTPGMISILLLYTTGNELVYFNNKQISSYMLTYSYHDQNMSVIGTCK